MRAILPLFQDNMAFLRYPSEVVVLETCCIFRTNMHFICELPCHLLFLSKIFLTVHVVKFSSLHYFLQDVCDGYIGLWNIDSAPIQKQHRYGFEMNYSPY